MANKRLFYPIISVSISPNDKEGVWAYELPGIDRIPNRSFAFDLLTNSITYFNDDEVKPDFIIEAKPAK
jgi:hypothetical protein